MSTTPSPSPTRITTESGWQVAPPSGWFTFGTHAGQDVALEFWGAEFDDGGLPIWERPAAPPVSDTAAPTITPGVREHRHACHDGNRDPDCRECVAPDLEAACLAVHQALASDWMTVVSALDGDQRRYEALLSTIAAAALGLTVTERSEVLTDKADQ